MNKLVLHTTFLIIFLFTVLEAISQQPRVVTRRYMVSNGDTLMVAYVATIPIFRSGRKGRVAMEKYQRLINAVKLTYPIAQEARRRLAEMEEKLDKLPNNKSRREYVKGIEEELKKEYTPILKRMSMYQGRILLKLIDRQTGATSYELVKELRGKFAAFFWQGVARIFGANLKTEYDAEVEDALLEGIIQLYEEELI